MDQLKFIEADLAELIKMAKTAKADMLAYLLELAFVEASDELNRRRQKQARP